RSGSIGSSAAQPTNRRPPITFHQRRCTRGASRILYPWPTSASPSNIQGGSRMRECRTSGSGAARLAAIPPGASPVNTRSPVHVVVIPSGREGDQTAGSLEVKALWGRGDLVRSVKGG